MTYERSQQQNVYETVPGIYVQVDDLKKLFWLVTKDLNIQLEGTEEVSFGTRHLLNAGIEKPTICVLCRSGFLIPTNQDSGIHQGEECLELTPSEARRICITEKQIWSLTGWGQQFLQRVFLGKNLAAEILDPCTDLVEEKELGEGSKPISVEQIPTPLQNLACVTLPKHVYPIWSPEEKTLSFAGQIVKQFRWKATNQQRILDAFQEEGWPRRIADPLPPSGKVCPKQRLGDTIKCLNRKQINHCIKFHGDGTGQGVFWEPVNPPCKCEQDGQDAEPDSEGKK